MAHQYINQLVVSKGGGTTSEIRDAVFGNVGTMQSFKVGADDAEYLAKEYAPVLTEQDIIGIANYKAYLKLNIDSSASRPFSLETIYDTKGASEKIREIAKQYSRMKHGRKKIFVDQEITSRIGIDISGGAKKEKPFKEKLKDKGLVDEEEPPKNGEKDIGKILQTARSKEQGAEETASKQFQPETQAPPTSDTSQQPKAEAVADAPAVDATATVIQTAKSKEQGADEAVTDNMAPPAEEPAKQDANKIPPPPKMGSALESDKSPSENAKTET